MTEKNLEGQIVQMNGQIQKLQKELQAVREQLGKTESNRDEYKSKYFQFKGIFQKQTHIFYLYQGLSEYSLDALSGIFKGTSFEEFLACGVQPGNIDALWEFSRGQALASDIEDVAILNKIIEYFVHLYNGTNESPILAFQAISPGDAFDVDLHIRTQESRASGKISNVVLAGLANAYTGEIIKKAVVEIL